MGEDPVLPRWAQWNLRGPYKREVGGSEAERSSMRKTQQPFRLSAPATSLQIPGHSRQVTGFAEEGKNAHTRRPRPACSLGS